MKTKNFKIGAASFYMIIVCTLLFGVITAGFAALMISEMNKSSENNLAQSAYDSALVGVEDAKILLEKYAECGGDETKEGCGKIVRVFKDYKADISPCYDFRDALGRAKGDGGGTAIKETTEGGATTVQEYSCVSINRTPSDYLASLSGASPIRVIPLQATGDDNKFIESVRISWYSTENLGNQSTSFANFDGNEIVFSNDASNPPVLAAQIYQAPENFKLGDFTDTLEVGADSFTNRGTLWLIPSDSQTNPLPEGSTTKSHYDTDSWSNTFPKNSSGNITDQSRTIILKDDALKNANNHDLDISHTGYPVRCAKNTESSGLDYLCSVVIKLTKPVVKNETGAPSGTEGTRSSDRGSFLLVLSLPYNQPTTDFKVEMSTGSTPFNSDGNYQAAQFDGVQTVIDSTGRANDVYSRVESRVELYDSDFPFPEYALTLGGDGSSDALWKDFWITSGNSDGCWYSSVSGGISTGAQNCNN